MEEPPEDLLCAAAIAGDCTRLDYLLLNGADPSFSDSDGMTPLMHAAAGGHADAVRCLLHAGAPWNARSPSNPSAGDLALENGHQEVIEALVNFAIAFARGDEGEFLIERVAFEEGRIVDAESEAGTIAWQKPLMEAHARAICRSGDASGRILNVGFGMGLVDEAIQRYNPMEHAIVEAHHDVRDRMKRSGWGEVKNVKIVVGKWQDVLPQLGSFDGIFFDTHNKCYKEVREFHQNLHKLLKPGGIYSFFNGFCASNAFFNIVYCRFIASELEKLGFSTQFIPLPVEECLLKETRNGVKHRYWSLNTYNLPLCQASLVSM